MNIISKASQVFLNEEPPLVKAHFLCAESPYDMVDNPDGYINMGTAENFLMDKEIELKLSELGVRPNFKFHYDYPQGSIELRKSYSKFLSKFLNIQNISEEKIVFASGASAVIEMLTNSICDKGDEILFFSPLYNGFYHDVETRFLAKIQISNCLSTQGFCLETLELDVQKYSKLKAVMINNPHNPTGRCLSAKELESIILICKKYNLEIISDEIYAKSVFGEEEFISLLDDRFLNLDYLNHIHHIYGLAKDFCMSGLKVGVFCSHNTDLLKCMSAQAYFHTVSTQTQHLVSELFGAEQWCEKFFQLNCTRLMKARSKIVDSLLRYKIDVFPGSSGIFIWADFSEILNIRTYEEEDQIFDSFINELKVNLSPGQTFACSKPGYFRICFAKPEKIINEFLARLDRFFEDRT